MAQKAKYIANDVKVLSVEDGGFSFTLTITTGDVFGNVLILESLNTAYMTHHNLVFQVPLDFFKKNFKLEE